MASRACVSQILSLWRHGPQGYIDSDECMCEHDLNPDICVCVGSALHLGTQVSDVDPDDVKKEEKRQKAGEVGGLPLNACVLARKPARAGLCVISLQNKSIAPH